MPSLSISKSLLIPVMQTPGYFWQHCLRGNQLHSWTGFSVQLATLEIWDITNIPVIITATGLYYASLLCCLRPRSSVLRSACTSIWSHLSPISKTSSIHIQRISAYIGIPGNSLADLEAKRGSTLPQTSVPVDLATAKALIRRVGQEEFHTCYTRDLHSATHSTLTAETKSAGTLEIRLDQKPVHHCCSAENGPLSTSGHLPSPHRMTTVSSVSVLQRRQRDSTASSSLLPVAHAGTIIHIWPTTSTQLILDACGPFWSRSGPWHVTRNERETERSHR